MKTYGSWISYMLHLQQEDYKQWRYDSPQINQIVCGTNDPGTLLRQGLPWMYLLDYTQGKYLMVSDFTKTFIGYDRSYFLDGGVNLTLDKYHPAHLNLFNTKIFPERLRILASIPPAKHPDYVFTYNFLFKNGSGEYVNLLQRNCFIQSDEKGKPLLSFGTVTNVDHYISSNPIVQTVERINEGSFEGKRSLFSKSTFYLNDEDQVFSKREKELLPLIAAGFTSKEIASKLFISEHTVINHKRHMMSKCNARNITELVVYAVKNHIL